MRLDELERELRGERPEIDSAFAQNLNEWAARGFPRGGELDPRGQGEAERASGRLRRAWTRARAVPARRTLGPVAAAATLLVIVGAVVVNQVDRGGLMTTVDPAPMDAGGESGGEEAADAPGPESSDAAAEFPQPDSDLGEGPQEHAFSPTEDQGRAGRGGGAALSPSIGNQRQRRIARTVSLSLATSPDDFRAAADAVLDVVAEHNGFVVRSSVSGGDPEVEGAELGRASFGLRIPARRLQATLGALSDLGHLVSRTDGSRDITARFRSARERIETFTDARGRLLRRLEEAATESEQASIERRLRIVERRLEAARDDLARAQARVRNVPVTVTIAADSAIRAGSGWGVGEALDDAVDILRTATAIAVVVAAALLPFALLALIGIVASRRLVQRRRERALDEA